MAKDIFIKTGRQIMPNAISILFFFALLLGIASATINITSANGSVLYLHYDAASSSYTGAGDNPQAYLSVCQPGYTSGSRYMGILFKGGNLTYRLNSALFDYVPFTVPASGCVSKEFSIDAIRARLPGVLYAGLGAGSTIDVNNDEFTSLGLGVSKSWFVGRYAANYSQSGSNVTVNVTDAYSDVLCGSGDRINDTTNSMIITVFDSSDSLIGSGFAQLGTAVEIPVSGTMAWIRINNLTPTTCLESQSSFCPAANYICPDALNTCSWTCCESGDCTKTNQIVGCFNITQPGYYKISANLSSASSCIEISASDVSLNVDNYYITGNGTGYGIYVKNANNVSISNATVSNFSAGIYFESSNNGTVDYVTSSGNTNGFVLDQSSSNSFWHGNTSNNSGTGVLIVQNTSTGNIFNQQYSCSNGYDVNDADNSTWILLTAQNSTPPALWTQPCVSILSVNISTQNGGSAITFKPVVLYNNDRVVLWSNESSNTTDGNTGFIVSNSGNINSTWNISSDTDAATFIGGTNPSFQYWGAIKQTGACENLNTNFVELNPSIKALCGNVNFHPLRSQIFTFVKLNISEAPPAVKNAVITISAYANQ